MDEMHKRKPEEYSLIATFIFCLQSNASLSALGFADVPIYTPTPPPVKPPRAKKEPKPKKSQAEVDDEEDAEDDATSVADAMDEQKWELKEPKEQSAKTKSSITQQIEQKTQHAAKTKSSEAKQPKPKKQKAPTFNPRPTSNEILSTLLHRKPIIESKKEMSRSLSFSRTELFDRELTPNMGGLVSQNEEMREDFTETPGVESDNQTGLAISSKNDSSALEKKQAQEKIVATPDAEANNKKGLVLHGEVGAPAHQAFLATASMQGTESQAMPSNAAEDTQMGTKASTTLPFSLQAVNETPSQNTGDFMENAQAQLICSIVENPDYELLTPPASAKKPILAQLPHGDVESLLAQRLLNTSQLQLLHQSHATQMSPASPLSQATAASTQGNDRETPVDDDKTIHNLEALSQDSGIARPSSPVFSEATEIADPMEIMESVKNSQRTDHEFHQQVMFRQNDNSCQEDENSGYHTAASPILGTVKKSAEDVSMLDLKHDGVREEVRERRQHVSPTPTPTGSFNFPQGEKRKVITGCENSEERQPRKLQKTGSLEQRMLAAQAKLAAAEKRNRQLEDERQAALAIKKKNDEVRELQRIPSENLAKHGQVEALLRKAEDMEQENLKLKVRIAHFWEQTSEKR